MELYKLTATIKNHTPATIFEFELLPENFEGVKISQSFSFVNPIGYTLLSKNLCRPTDRKSIEEDYTFIEESSLYEYLQIVNICSDTYSMN